MINQRVFVCARAFRRVVMVQTGCLVPLNE
jgi:hypothetical protein